MEKTSKKYEAISSKGAGIDFALASWGVRDHEREQLQQESDYVLSDPREIIGMIRSRLGGD